MADFAVTASTGRTIHLAQFDRTAPGTGSRLRVVEFCKPLRILSRRSHDELLIAQGALPWHAPGATSSLHVGSQPGHSGYVLAEHVDQRHHCRAHLDSRFAIRENSARCAGVFGTQYSVDHAVELFGRALELSC